MSWCSPSSTSYSFASDFAKNLDHVGPEELRQAWSALRLVCCVNHCMTIQLHLESKSFWREGSVLSDGMETNLFLHRLLLIIPHFKVSLVLSPFIVTNLFSKGSFTNYVICFSLFFDHPPTYGYALASILLIIYLIDVCDSYILLTTHPPRMHNLICERPHIRNREK